MPRLPDARDFGERPSYGPTRSIPDTAGVGAPVEGAAHSAMRQATRNGGAIGEAAQALEGVANQLISARKKTQSRVDTIQRIKAISEFEELAGSELVRLQAEDDYSDPGTVDKYLTSLKEAQSSILGAHAGTEESRQMLEVDLSERLSAYARRSAEAHIGAQRQIVGDRIKTDMGRYAREAYESPENLSAVLHMWGNQLGRHRGALDVNEEQAALKVGIEQIVTSGIQSFIDQGDYVDASNALAAVPEEFLSPNTFMRLHRDIALGSASGKRESNRYEEALAALRGALGRDPTEMEVLRVIGAEPPDPKERSAPKTIDAMDGDENVTLQYNPATDRYDIEVARGRKPMSPLEAMIENLNAQKGGGAGGEEGAAPTTSKGAAKGEGAGQKHNGLDIVTSDAQYNALPSGTDFYYRDENGVLRLGTKP